MKPNYISQSGKIRFYNYDCNDFMRECKENEYDLAIVEWKQKQFPLF